MSTFDAADIVASEFAGLSLGDARRERRARSVLEALIEQPTASIPRQHGGPARTKACYRLLENDDVSFEALLEPHQNATVARCRQRATVLAVQDTTAVSLSGLQAAEGLGPINDSLTNSGYLVHTTLMVDPGTGAALGLAAQQVWVRPRQTYSRDETAEERRKRARESEHWWLGQEAVARAFGRSQTEDIWCPPAAGDPYIIAVFDREGDIFEVFETAQKLGYGFVVRAIHSRRFAEERPFKRVRKGQTPDAEAAEPRYSFDEARTGQLLGQFVVPVPRTQKHKARDAIIEVRVATTPLSPPKNRGRKGDVQVVTQVYVKEVSPPEGVDALEWWLVTSELVLVLDDAVRIVSYYQRRWLIEEFHMGLKTGVAIEERQFESFDMHKRFLAFASIVAWTGLSLRDAARQPSPVSGASLLTPTQFEVLRVLAPKVDIQADAREVFHAIAMLGGFMGRKGDGERTITRGLQRLFAVEEGYLLARGGVLPSTA